MSKGVKRLAMQLVNKFLEAFIALIIIFALITGVFIPQVALQNWTSVNGVDYTWVLSLIVVLVFVGLAYGVYKSLLHVGR